LQENPIVVYAPLERGKNELRLFSVDRKTKASGGASGRHENDALFIHSFTD